MDSSPLPLVLAPLLCLLVLLLLPGCNAAAAGFSSDFGVCSKQEVSCHCWTRILLLYIHRC